MFEMCCQQAIRGCTRADRLQDSKIREDTFTPESIRYQHTHKTQVVWARLPYVKRLHRYASIQTRLQRTVEERKTTEDVS